MSRELPACARRPGRRPQPRRHLRDCSRGRASPTSARPSGSRRCRSAAGGSTSPRWRPHARRSARSCTSPRTPRTPGPRVLLVAPLSGHFATLLRDTVRTLLRDHDVYLTDWHNARDVGDRARPLRARRVRRARDPVPRGARARRPRDGGVPAVRPRARRGRGDGRGPQPGAADEHDPHGRADRRAASRPRP